jgi:hypothetical protein
MVSLVKPKLGTDPVTGWRFYSLHLASSYILREFFLVSNYQSCINNIKDNDVKTRKNVELVEKIKGPFPQKKFILARADELSKWAKEMETQNYHELYVHSFVGMWSAFETGIENIVADFIENDKEIAVSLIEKFKPGRYKEDEWPFQREICLEIAQKIESKAKSSTQNGGLDLYARYQTMFSWMNIEIEVENKHRENLSEANRVRNILLHRYGEITEKDANEFPSLKNWIGSVMPLTKSKFTEYYESVISTLTSIMRAISLTVMKNPG